MLGKILIGLIAITSADQPALDLPKTDQLFAAKAIEVARPGRSWTEVEQELISNGFSCWQSKTQDLGDSGKVFHEYKCGASVPALHGCVRNAAIGTFDGVVKHLTITLQHPSGSSSDGSECGR